MRRKTAFPFLFLIEDYKIEDWKIED